MSRTTTARGVCNQWWDGAGVRLKPEASDVAHLALPRRSPSTFKLRRNIFAALRQLEGDITSATSGLPTTPPTPATATNG